MCLRRNSNLEKRLTLEKKSILKRIWHWKIIRLRKRNRFWKRNRLKKALKKVSERKFDFEMDSKFLIKFCFMLLKIKSINETSFNKSGWSLHQFTMTSTLHLFNYQNSKLFFKTIQQMRFRTQLGCRPIVRV